MRNRVLWISLTVLSLCVIVFLLVPVNVSAASSGELLAQLNQLKDEQFQLQSQIQEIEDSLAENNNQTAAMVQQKNQLDEQIFLLHEQLENTQDQIKGYRLLQADTQEELEKAQERLDVLHQTHKQRLRSTEEQGQLSYWSVLLKSNSMSDFLDRLMMMLEILRADRQRLERLQQAADEVKALQLQLESERDQLEALHNQQESTLQTLEDKRAEADALLQSLLAKGNEYSLLLWESEKKQETLMEKIAQKENDYDLQAQQEWLATSVPETTQSTLAEESRPAGFSQWMTPVPYYTLTSPFGMRLHPILGIYRMHNGVDLGCAQGTPIYATRGGVVSITDYEEFGAGNYIQINHGDGYRSVYMHMTHYVVALGQRVEAGQIIGYVGSTGLSDGPHLHFGISYQGTYLNPMQFIN